ASGAEKRRDSSDSRYCPCAARSAGRSAAASVLSAQIATSSISKLLSLARRADRSDRKSTRLNSSHVKISYAVFCLKKKNYNMVSRELPHKIEPLEFHFIGFDDQNI